MNNKKMVKINKKFKRKRNVGRHAKVFKKYYGKKLYLDLGLGCFISGCYLHSVKENEFGECFVFIKKKGKISYRKALNSGVRVFNSTTDCFVFHTSKKKFMKIKC